MSGLDLGLLRSEQHLERIFAGGPRFSQSREGSAAEVRSEVRRPLKSTICRYPVLNRFNTGFSDGSSHF